MRLAVDFGSGVGHLIPYLCCYFERSIALDISFLSLKRQNTLFISPPTSIVGDVIQTPFKNNSVDFVCCFSVLHHIYRPSSLLKEAVRILRPGGFLYTDWDPNYNSVYIDRHGIMARIESFLKRSDCSQVYKLAEIHQVNGGLKIDDIQRWIRKAGLTLQVFLVHSNSKDFLTPVLFSGPFRHKLRVLLRCLSSRSISQSKIGSMILTLSQKTGTNTTAQLST